MQDLTELKKKHEELGKEIERLERVNSINPVYVFTAFVSISIPEDNQSVIAEWGVTSDFSSILNKARVLIDSGTYGFARAYAYGHKVYIVNNNNENHEKYEKLNTREDCREHPTSEIQAKHKEIIKKYIIERGE